MRFLRKSLIGLFLLSLTLGLLGYAVGSVRDAVSAKMAEEPRSRPARERVFSVNAVAIQPETIEPVLEVFGEVQARRTLDIRPATSGTVIELADGFVEGGQVQAGQVLLRVDPTDAEAGVALADADLADARAELLEAERALILSEDELFAAQEQAALRERAFERQKDLVDRGVGTPAAVENAELAASSARQSVLSRRQSIQQAEARLNTAGIRVDRAEISLAEAKRTLADTTVTAAFSGTLSQVAIVEGGVISANERLAQLVDPSALEVAVRVSTAQYTRLSDGGTLTQAPVTVTLDVLGVDINAQGRLTRESAAVGDGQTGRQLFVSLSDADGFRPGDFVTVEIQEPAIQRVARLPSSAVSAAGKVLVVGDDERLSEADVQLVRRQGDDVLVRARGLRDAQVVAERSPLLGAGIKVRVLAPPGEAVVPEAPAMVSLDDARRARLIAFIEGNNRMPAAAKERVLAQLQEPEVPAAVVERIEGRMGG